MSDTAQNPVGVLVMSYGTPAGFDQVEAYYTHIRHGRPPSPEQLADLIERYRMIGGVFPLREHTNRQVEGLQRELDRRAGKGRYVCYQGLKHVPPFIEDGVAKMAEDGIRRAVGIVLAPHDSAMSVGAYIKRAEAEAGKQGVRMAFVREYHLHPELIGAFADRVKRALDRFGDRRGDALVLFSAHSLPEKILAWNDPYPGQLLATSRAVAEAAGVERWKFSWQSAGQTGEPWLGPDLLESLEQAAEEGVREVLVAPVGFVSDHLEVLYDVDIEAKRFAEEKGMRLERIEMLNDDPRFMRVLADCVQAAEEGLP
ncbi:MAG: ferrochelatase [Paenibacillaceae bacterium ZCTH02-B3]|nr:MAG: ferrochelatase [Paenibacillaceae bacterium ZCTH02-B3]